MYDPIALELRIAVLERQLDDLVIKFTLLLLALGAYALVRLGVWCVREIKKPAVPEEETTGCVFTDPR